MRFFSVIALLLPAFAAFGQNSFPGNYNYAPVLGPSSIGVFPNGINSSGQVVGSYTTGLYSAPHGILIANQNYTTIDVPGSLGTKLLSIDDNGKIYGVYTTQANYQQPFSYNNGVFTDLPFNLAGAVSYTVNAMSPSGSVVGTFVDANSLRQGFLYVNGIMTVLNHPLDQQGATTNPIAVNESGEVVGTYSGLIGGFIFDGGFSYSQGTYLNIDGPYPGGYFHPTGIGPNGQILGMSPGPLGYGSVPFLYYNDVYTPINPVAGGYADLTIFGPGTPIAINSSGLITGSLNSYDTFNGFLASPLTFSAGETIKVFIDEPAPGTSKAGRLAVSGWAINSDNPVSSVTLQIDGLPVSVASYGTGRPDVCAAYPNQVMCPNVGWTASIDTTRFSVGAHFLNAVATSIDGHHAIASVNFNVLPPTDLPNPVQLFVDQPSANSGPLSGVTTISGWAFHTSEDISTITVSIDRNAGVSNYIYGFTAYGLSRPDVCGVYPTSPNCPNVGWTYQLDTTTLSNGTHTALVTAYSLDGHQNSTTVSFSVLNNNGIKTFVDQPQNNTAPLSGQTVFSGWTLDSSQKIGVVQFLVDGQSYDSLYASFTGGYRPDVCVANQSPDCPNVGWTFPFDTTQLANGPHILTILADSSGYPTKTLLSSPVSFTVFNPSTSPNTTRLFIDQPTSSNAVLAGSASFSGWAIDDATTIREVQMLVDGLPAGNATPFQSRPDVCAVYSNRPGCPNVGWTFGLDTLQLTNGNHTITATAVSYAGSRATVSQSFIVSNSIPADATRLFIDRPSSQAEPLSGNATFGGWALNDSQYVEDVEILIDGSSFGLAAYGTPRQDVCNTYPGRPDCPNAGWTYTLDTGRLSNGTHALEVRARGKSVYQKDSQYAVQTTFFTVQNSAPMSIRAFIDHPDSGTASLAGVSSIAGWALYDYGPIQDVQISIDHVQFGTATYGLTRDDVCIAYPGKAGCPNVGWALALDTTLLSNGKHEAEITVTTADGLSETLTRNFSVSN